GRGGLVRNIWCDRIYMKDIVSYGVVFNLYYAGVSATEMSKDGQPDIQPVDETTPEFRDMWFSNLVCQGADQAIFINGIPELPVSGLHFSNSVFTSDKDVEIYNAKDITFEQVQVNGKPVE
ncbi:MAG: glycoside hydrolase family 28 protein, partial [Bacteroidales bacterium]|nr:glycoside hydrolase family 28 protein [Bacteroidales bacterium]